LDAAHGILNKMLQFHVAVVKAMPMWIYFVRFVCAITILIKMHIDVCKPSGELDARLGLQAPRQH